MEDQKYYKTWESYTEEYPELKEEKYHADMLQTYEDDLYKFIIGLLI
ncbi:MAG: hypothetical protein Q4C55_01025 [Eubacterium sp.]|nr:hypothetical protein [Eubacterium sp.]